MNKQTREQLAHVVEATIRAGDSVTIFELIDAVEDSGVIANVAPGSVRMCIDLAITAIRKSLVNEVIVHAHDHYHFAANAIEAEVWRRRMAVQLMHRIENLGTYATAEQIRFGHRESPDEAWSMAHESLQRARRDVERASRLTFG